MTSIPKPEPRKAEKARERRIAAQVVRVVRHAVSERDGRCRLLGRAAFGPCSGPSEWAHLEGRWKTRGKAPDERHRTVNTVMLCRTHHDQLDGRRRPRIQAEALTAFGADGRLRWVIAGATVYEEPR